LFPHNLKRIKRNFRKLPQKKKEVDKATPGKTIVFSIELWWGKVGGAVEGKTSVTHKPGPKKDQTQTGKGRGEGKEKGRVARTLKAKKIQTSKKKNKKPKNGTRNDNRGLQGFLGGG